MARTRIKICGITRRQDAAAAVNAGADAVGLVFYADSPRAVTPEQAQAIVADVPAMVTTVGLFVDADPGWVAEVSDGLSLGLLQFHGSETPGYCEGFQRPWMKALRVAAAMNVADEIDRYSGGSAILLDTYKKGVPGGTGERFDWGQVPSAPRLPLVLAGGLDAGNVQEAIAETGPYAVDVSGGVEAAPGIKSVDRIEAFVSAVRRADPNRRLENTEQ